MLIINDGDVVVSVLQHSSSPQQQQQEQQHKNNRNKPAAQSRHIVVRAIIGTISSIAVFVFIAILPLSPLEQSWWIATSTPPTAALPASSQFSLTAAGAAVSDPKQIVKAGDERSRSDDNGGRMALFAQVRTDMGDVLVISIHTHSGSKCNLLKQDVRTICNEIKNKWSDNGNGNGSGKNDINVLMGGDIDMPIPETLVSECGFFDLKKTNSKQRRSNRLVPTWKVGKVHAQ
jgi:hypothetical protein